MKVLISGSNGFVGSYLKKNFLKEGHAVVSIGKSSLNDYSIDLENASIDLNNFYDLIIHTAGIVHDNNHANNINIDSIVKDLNITHMDAILYYCDKEGIEPDSVGSLISKGLKEKIEANARDLNFLPKRAQLPI